MMGSATRTQDYFRDHVVGAAVDAWLSADWVAKCDEFRDEEWSEQLRLLALKPASERGPEDRVRTSVRELALFRASLTTRTLPMGLAYLHVAAGVLQQGILLLGSDSRMDTLTSLHDFGTRQYETSIVLFHHVGAVKDRGSRGDGHFETVCLLSAAGGCQADTMFERNHPLLCCLRSWAAQHSTEQTLDHKRICYTYHSAISMLPGEAFQGLAPPAGLVRLPSLVPVHVGTRPRRKANMPVRFRGDAEQKSGAGMPSTPSGARPAVMRSLQGDLDRAAAASPHSSDVHREPPTCARVTNVRGPPSSSRGRAVGTVRAASRTAPVVAAPRMDSSDRMHVLGESARRNLREWVRQHSQRGRLASRVHHSAVPMWTLRCRTVLQGLATALRQVPTDVTRVVTWLCVLWMLPQEVFTVPGRSRGGKHGRKLRHHRIHYMLNDAALLGRLADSVEGRAVAAPVAGGPAPPNADVDGARPGVPDEIEAACASLSSLGLADQGRDFCASTTEEDGGDDEDGDGDDVLGNVGDANADDGASSGRYASAGASASPMSAAGGAGALAADRAVAHRAERLMREDHLHRAMRALVSTTEKADLGLESERAALRALHPPCASVLPVCPADAPSLVVDAGAMAQLMRDSDTGASPGLSGYGSNFISVLADDHSCVEAMALLIGHIVNDTLPDAVRGLLNTCVLVSLKKSPTGRRPVAVGDMLYRMAARFSLSLVMKKGGPAHDLLRPYQFGVGVEDGCTQVVQTLQHLLTLPPEPDVSMPDAAPPAPQNAPAVAASPVLAAAGSAAPGLGDDAMVPPPSPVARPLACLSIDIANAFNTVDRAVLLRAVYSQPAVAKCWRMVSFGYGRPSLLLMDCGDDVPNDDAFIESSNGVRQGDALSTLLFSLAMHPVYEAIAQECRGGCFAYVDDGHGVGWLEDCWRAWLALPALLSRLGLHLNTAKCELTCFYTDGLQHAQDVAALQAFRGAGLAINSTALKVLGCVVGSSDAVIAGELARRPAFRADQRAAFRRIPLLSKQAGYLALTQLTGTVLTNRLRAMPPAATQQHAVQYDREVLRAAHVLVGISPVDGDRYDEQLRWPCRLGGFALLSAERIAAPAYVAGAECTLRHCPAFARLWSTAATLDATWSLTLSIDDALARIRVLEAGFISRCPAKLIARVTPSVLPARAADFVRAFRGGQLAVQSAIIHRITTLSHSATMTAVAGAGALAVPDLARLRALRAKGSSRWLRVRPTDKALSMTDPQWQTAAQLRLGMSRPPHGDAAACEHRDAADRDGWHALVCTTRSGPAINERHHAVVRILADAARRLNVTARIEPHQLCEHDDSRPDIQLDLADCTLLGDVTISHPLAACWRHVAAKRGVVAVGNARCAEKNDHYGPMAAAMGPDVHFLPFVLYTYGGCHQSVASFIRLLGTAHDRGLALVSYADWKSDLQDRIAVSVQRHTADIMIQDARRARSAEVTRRCRRHSGLGKRASLRRYVSQPATVAAAWSSARSGLRASDSLSAACGARAAHLCAALLASAECLPASSPASPTVVESDDDTVGVRSEPGSPRPVRGSDSDAVMVDDEPVQLMKKKKNRAASLATGAREAPEAEPSVVAPSGAVLYIRAGSGVHDAAGAARGGDVVDDAVMEDASDGVPCSGSDSESESCGVLLPAAAAVHAATVPDGWMESLWRTQPAVLRVVSGPSGVSVSSVCDGVVLASSVVEVAVQVEQC